MRPLSTAYIAPRYSYKKENGLTPVVHSWGRTTANWLKDIFFGFLSSCAKACMKQSFLFLYVNAWRRKGAISPIKQTAFRKSRLERLLTGTLADLLFILLKDFCCDLLFGSAGRGFRSFWLSGPLE